MKKFELTSEFVTFLGKKLFRIKALISFGNVEEGELGGYVEKEENLSNDGNAWVYGNARVCGDAEVCGDARVYGNADYATVHGFGSEYRTTTFFRTKAGEIGVRCGCFYGTLEEFRAKIKETHGETKTAKEYLMVADLMEFRFSKEEAWMKKWEFNDDIPAEEAVGLIRAVARFYETINDEYISSTDRTVLAILGIEKAGELHD
mgnify:CR=1 FL=1